MQQVWKTAPFVSLAETGEWNDFETAWERVKAKICLPPVGLAEGPLTPWLMWSLWTTRNKLVFEDKIITTEEALDSAIIMAKEWSESQQTILEPIRGKQQHTKYRTTNLSICHSDGSWRSETRRAGLGWVFLENGEVMEEQSMTVTHVSSPLVAEALALREAVRHSLEKSFKNMRFESDSSQLIKAINSDTSLLQLHGIIEDIKVLAYAFDHVSFSSITRKLNAKADCLAKQAINVMVLSSG